MIPILTIDQNLLNQVVREVQARSTSSFNTLNAIKYIDQTQAQKQSSNLSESPTTVDPIPSSE